MFTGRANLYSCLSQADASLMYLAWMRLWSYHSNPVQGLCFSREHDRWRASSTSLSGIEPYAFVRSRKNWIKSPFPSFPSLMSCVTTPVCSKQPSTLGIPPFWPEVSVWQFFRRNSVVLTGCWKISRLWCLAVRLSWTGWFSLCFMFVSYTLSTPALIPNSSLAQDHPEGFPKLLKDLQAALVHSVWNSTCPWGRGWSSTFFHLS